MKLLGLLLLLSVQSGATIDETPDLRSCLAIAADHTRGENPQEVLYVFDIDNTVLALNQNLGSVQWFRWQAGLIHNEINKERVAKTVDELLNKQSWIYQFSSTHSPETTTSLVVSKIQSAGSPVLYHTSRSTDVRDLTERELIKNNLLPLSRTVGPPNGIAGKFNFPDAPSTQKEVSFQNGIYMSAGQDKGIWLSLLLRKFSATPKHLVFVDDEIKNLKNVERAFENKLPMTLCRYGKLDELVDVFNKSDKQTEVDLWNELSAVHKKFEGNKESPRTAVVY